MDHRNCGRVDPPDRNRWYWLPGVPSLGSTCLGNALAGHPSVGRRAWYAVAAFPGFTCPEIYRVFPAQVSWRRSDLHRCACPDRAWSHLARPQPWTPPARQPPCGANSRTCCTPARRTGLPELQAPGPGRLVTLPLLWRRSTADVRGAEETRRAR